MWKKSEGLTTFQMHCKLQCPEGITPFYGFYFYGWNDQWRAQHEHEHMQTFEKSEFTLFEKIDVKGKTIMKMNRVAHSIY